MSLNGIFDPMVRAYFEKNGGSGGGTSGGKGGVAVFCADKAIAGEYEQFDSHMFHISDATPDENALNGGLIVMRSVGATTITNVVFEVVTEPDEYVTGAGYFPSSTSDEPTYLFIGVKEESAAEVGLSAGIWFTPASETLLTSGAEVWLCWEN